MLLNVFAAYGPWEHAPPHVWTDHSNSAAMQDEAEDEAEVCVLCCQKRSTVAVCDECKEHYCTPPPPCLSYALVQATVDVGTVLIWYLILIRYQI